ncbi:hypothetical protein WQ57_18460 [Mesobacillus campisalis]|uniref:Type II secretion system protein GspF domain-containing protein n=1 Tax=Mesobacillus campisalis TaxID=1408103 RepID=A0A0M2SQ05_9BACI|nr:type II secretion system F family protein [Mesobacillus campisalis]KKK36629.1 hypothetical protein WQ57_18460 [Mesobacillus campisalis]
MDNTLLTLLFIFLGSSLIIFLLLKNVFKKRWMENRMKDFLPVRKEEETEQNAAEKERQLKGALFSASRLFRNIQFSQRTEKLLLEAGSALKPEEYLFVRVSLFFLAGIGAFLFAFPWYVWVMAAVMAYVLPDIQMKRKREKRLKMISYQLVEILGMMANSMRAGFSFMQAMQLVGKEMPAPLGPEFERVVRESSLGVPLDDVFKEMVRRLPNKELEVVVRAILAQRKSGGNLAALMETMEDTVRGRIRILEELNTLTAQGRMSSWVITLLPVGLGLYLALVNKEYFDPMLNHPLGLLMLTVAGISIITGWFFIQRIIKIEV